MHIFTPEERNHDQRIRVAKKMEARDARDWITFEMELFRLFRQHGLKVIKYTTDGTEWHLVTEEAEARARHHVH